ncbi:MAG: hypothetical protein ABIL39_09370 [candidate division WOR-3 bacterium]
MAISKRFLFILPLLFFFSCSGEDINPKLLEYFKTEKELRKNINSEKELNDSLSALKTRLKIDPDKELKRFASKPELWLKFLKAIDGEK